jgi:3',5'-cyclic AMP phosphodiesterase CpdA
VPHPIVLHLTDLHFGYQSTNSNERVDRQIALNGLLSTIGDLHQDWKPSIICLSGDIAYTGSREDYQLALEWLRRLMDVCQLGPERVIACPGNHDVIRARALQQDRPSNANTADRILATDVPPVFNEIFAGYIWFCQEVGIQSLILDSKESWLVGAHEVIDGIQFVSLNTSWYCQGDDDLGKLWVGLPQIRSLVADRKLNSISNPSTPITIVLMHHPFSWLTQDDRVTRGSRNTAEYLARHCHILLTGHEHGRMGRAHQVSEGAQHFPGGAGYESGAYENGFRLIRLEGQHFVYRSYEYDASRTEDNWQQRGDDTTILKPGQPFVPIAESEKKKPLT